MLRYVALCCVSLRSSPHARAVLVWRRSAFPEMMKNYRGLMNETEGEYVNNDRGGLEEEEEKEEEGDLQEEKAGEQNEEQDEESDVGGEEQDDGGGRTTIAVLEAVCYTAKNDETGNQDKEQVRCSKSFMGGPWQDGVQLVEDNPDQGRMRKNNFKTKSGLTVGYEPSARRVFGIVQLLFEYGGRLWILVEKLEGADNKPGLPPWQNKIIPNWPHLRTLAQKGGKRPRSLKSRLEVFPVENVERVRIIVEDPNQAPDREVKEYWCPLGGVNDDSVPFHEVFDGDARYERHGELDEHGAPVVLFADAITVQPWDLCPPSAKTFAQRSRDMQRDYASSAGALPLSSSAQPACPVPAEEAGDEEEA